MLITMQPVATPFQDKAVEQVFDAYPDEAQGRLLGLRAMIFDIARTTPGVGEIVETLKWGQPAYLTERPKSGSTIRLGIPKQGGFALYTSCRTTIIPDFRSVFPDDFVFDGNRGIVFEQGAEPERGPLEILISKALTYHLGKRKR